MQFGTQQGTVSVVFLLSYEQATILLVIMSRYLHPLCNCVLDSGNSALLAVHNIALSSKTYSKSH